MILLNLKQKKNVLEVVSSDDIFLNITRQSQMSSLLVFFDTVL